MKHGLIYCLLICLSACHQPHGQAPAVPTRADSLEKQLAASYKPGFGDFMSSIQVHHNKLWWAGQKENWPLADFEVHEIMEALADIQHYQTERKESQLIGMINPALDSVNAAIQQHDPARFKRSYSLLTNTCNNCHRATNFGFNVVKIPDAPPFTNQDFTPQHDQ